MEATEQMAAVPAHWTGRNITWISNRHLSRWLPLAIIVIVAFVIRVAALVYCGTGAIEQEGAEYARIAENLRHGLGYVGIATPGLQLNFPPLFPLLIAGASFVTGNYEWAGRLVALILGSLLPLPVFGIASRLFNRRVGFVAAILTLLHPVLVNLSFAVFSEGPYITILLSAVYVVVRALNQPSIRLWCLVGGLFGLSYLVRVEGSAVFAIAVVFALIATKGDRMVKCTRAAVAIVVFLAFALPEVIFIYRATGNVRLDGKSKVFFYTGRRITAAEAAPVVDYVSPNGEHEVASSAPNVESGQRWEEKWALYGVDSHLKGTGTAMRPFAEIIRETRMTLKDQLLIGVGVVRYAPEFLYWFRSDWLGAPLWPALALLGAVRRPWRRPQASSRFFVMLVAAVPLLANPLALRMPSEPRNCFVFIPLLCIWAGNGLFEIGRWVKASSAAVGWRILAHPKISHYIIPGLIGLAMIISPVKGARRLYVFRDGSVATRADKALGVWIGRRQYGPVRIMDLRIPLAYHAGAQFSNFPYCTSDLALHYLDAAKVDYIILRPGEKFTAYYAQWLEQGIPSSRAELLHAPTAGSDHFIVYRWHGDDAPSSRPLSGQAHLQ